MSFERSAKASNLRTDFVAIHIYGPPDPQKFLQRLDAAYKHYRKPIWITEFAVADWSAREAGTNRYSEEQVMAFMKVVIPELEKRSYVERYAWFGAGRGSGKEAVRTSRLVDSRGALTPSDACMPASERVHAGPLRPHLIFDFGGVLFRWRPADLLARVLPQHIHSGEEAEHWKRQFFQAYQGDWGPSTAA